MQNKKRNCCSQRWAEVKALLQKNYLIKKRRLLATLTEIILPLIITILFVIFSILYYPPNKRESDNSTGEFDYMKSMTLQITIVPTLASIAILFPLKQYLIEKERGVIKQLQIMNCRESSNVLSLFIIQQPFLILVGLMITSIFCPFYMEKIMKNEPANSEVISFRFYFFNQLFAAIMHLETCLLTSILIAIWINDSQVAVIAAVWVTFSTNIFIFVNQWGQYEQYYYIIYSIAGVLIPPFIPLLLFERVLLPYDWEFQVSHNYEFIRTSYTKLILQGVIMIMFLFISIWFVIDFKDYKRKFKQNINGNDDLKEIESFVEDKNKQSEIAINFDKVNKKFSGMSNNVGLKEFSMIINSGEIFGILGSNGSGKSTILKLLSGMLKPQSGSIQVFHKSLRMCQQHDYLIEELTPKEHFALAVKLSMEKNSQIKKYSSYLLTNQELNTQVQKLSSGQKRILSILLSLVGNPSIIILDEPSANLDLKARLRVWKAIQSIKNDRTIVIATQIIEEAEILCERICIIKEGTILAMGNVQDVKKQHSFDLKLDITPILSFESNINNKASDAQYDESHETLMISINNLMNKHLSLGKLLIPNWNECQRLTYIVKSSQFENLVEVLKLIRFLYPSVRLEICSNDLETAFIQLFLSSSEENQDISMMLNSKDYYNSNDVNIAGTTYISRSLSNLKYRLKNNSFIEKQQFSRFSEFKAILFINMYQFFIEKWYLVSIMTFSILLSNALICLTMNFIWNSDYNMLYLLSISILAHQQLDDIKSQRSQYYRIQGISSMNYILARSITSYVYFCYISLLEFIFSTAIKREQINNYHYLKLSICINYLYAGLSITPLIQILAYIFRNSKNASSLIAITVIFLGHVIDQTSFLFFSIYAIYSYINSFLLFFVTALLQNSVIFYPDDHSLTYSEQANIYILQSILGFFWIIIALILKNYIQNQVNKECLNSKNKQLIEKKINEQKIEQVKFSQQLDKIPEAFDEDSSFITQSQLIEIPLVIEETQSQKKVIEVRDLWHTYDNKNFVLQGLNFDLISGKILGIIGTNGSGKSTLFNILTLGLQRTKGFIKYFGDKNIEDISNFGSKIGIVHQHNDFLFSKLTVNEHIQYYCNLGGLDSDSNIQRISKLKHLLQLNSYQDTPASFLSGGNKRKLCILIALLPNPEFLVFDEATANLDPISRKKLLNYIRQKCISAIIITQRVEEAEDFCDSVAFLSEGRFIMQDKPSELVSQYSHINYIVVALPNSDQLILNQTTLSRNQSTQPNQRFDTFTSDFDRQSIKLSIEDSLIREMLRELPFIEQVNEYSEDFKILSLSNPITIVNTQFQQLMFKFQNEKALKGTNNSKKAEDKLTYCVIQLSKLKQQNRIKEFKISQPKLEQIYHRIMYTDKLDKKAGDQIITTIND